MIKCSNRQRRELKTALAWRMPPAQRQRIQMVLLRESGITQAAIAEAMGVSLSTVNRAHMAYDRGGIKALKPKPNGGRKRENMTVGAPLRWLVTLAGNRRAQLARGRCGTYTQNTSLSRAQMGSVRAGIESARGWVRCRGR